MRHFYLLFFVVYTLRLTAQSVEMMPVGTVFHGRYFHYLGGPVLDEYMTLRVEKEEWKYGKWAKKIVRENGGAGFFPKWIYQSGDSIFGLNNPPFDTSWYFYYKNRYEMGETVDFPIGGSGSYTVTSIDTLYATTLPTVVYKFHEGRWFSDRFGPSIGLSFEWCGAPCDQAAFFICAISTPATGVLGNGVTDCAAMGFQIVSGSPEVQVESNRAFSVVPNPADAYFDLRLAPEVGPQDLWITDYLGRILYTQRQLSGTQRIVTAHWPPGMYYVRLGQAVQPMVVVRH